MTHTLKVDGDVPQHNPFLTEKSGRKITEMEAKNPDVIAMKLMYLYLVDIVDGCKSNY